jgi:hypothetical protein
MKLLPVVLLVPLVASAASVSGRVTDGATGLAGMEVRLWALTAKGYSFAPPNGQVVLTNATGDYAFTNVPAGSYKVDTRMPNGFSGNWGDRWLDVAAPMANGYVPEDADVLELTAASALTGVDIAVQLNGGFDGRVVNGSSQPQVGIFARAELVSDRRVHHNDTSKSLSVRLGEISFRGQVPGETRLVLHDPNYVLGDTIRTGLTVVSNTAPGIGDTAMAPAPADALEPNNAHSDANATFDGGGFRLAVPEAFRARGAIGPRNSGDTDWFCFEAVAGDRYVIDVAPTLTLEDGGVVDGPWFDPVASFWEVDAGLKLAEDDDTGPGRAARVDTGELANPGRHCAVVSAFGDTAWNGSNQGSAGTYALTIAMGNRRPALAVSSNGAPAPVPPAKLTIAEAESVTLDALFSDPDGNLSGGTFELRDAQNAVVSAGSVNLSTGAFSFTWTAPQTGARGSPYTFTVQVTDGEFTRTVTVVIEVTSVNLAPGLPTLLSPDAGASVATRTPTLVCAETFDLDEETLTYEFELTWDDGGVQTGSVVGVDGGWFADAGTAPPEVALAAAALPENARVSWRVRAFDGNAANGYSPWTAPWTFFVDSINDPPPAPVLTKPADGEELLVRRPTLEATNPVDPEGEAVTLTFQVAADVAFTAVVHTSPATPVTTGSTHTMYTLPLDLNWGGSYYARATATDTRGGVSPASNVNHFTVRANTAPTPPAFGAPLASCGSSGLTVMAAPTTLVVPNVADVEQDAITLQLELFNAADNPATATPLFSQTAAQQGTADTTFTIAGVAWVEDASYRVRVRALDGLNITAWTECVFTLNAMSGTGGGGGSATGGGSGTGGGSATGGGTGGGSATGGGTGTGGGSATGGGTGTGGGSATGGGTGTGGGDPGTGGGEPGTGGGAGGGDPAATPGCGCTAVDPLASLALVLALALRRRRR